MGWTVENNVYSFSADITIKAPVEQVYPVVRDVESYPEFLPDISSAREQGDEFILVYKAGPLDISVTSVFESETNSFIRFHLKDGPLKNMMGEWLFTPTGSGTKVTMRTSFEPKLTSRWFLRMTEKMLEYKTNNILSRFVERLESLTQ